MAQFMFYISLKSSKIIKVPPLRVLVDNRDVIGFERLSSKNKIIEL